MSTASLTYASAVTTHDNHEVFSNTDLNIEACPLHATVT